MGKRSHLSPAVRAVIIDRRKRGQTLREIAREVGCSYGAVQTALRLAAKGPPYTDSCRSGRPQVTTERLDRLMYRVSSAQPMKTAVNIQREINRTHGTSVSVRTVRRRLCDKGLFGRIAVKKPLVSEVNRRRRLQWARQHQHWTADQWASVLWTDESKINRLGSDGATYVRRRRGERFAPRCLLPTLRGGGGSVMVWAAFSSSGTGPIHRIQGMLKSTDYRDLLSDVLMPYATDNMPGQWILQHDNAPVHMGHVVTEWLAQQQVTVLSWPPQSPDLNPLETLWTDLKKAVHEQHPSNKEELWTAAKEAWQQISVDRCRRLVDSMPRRCAAVLRSRGHPTRY